MNKTTPDDLQPGDRPGTPLARHTTGRRRRQAGSGSEARFRELADAMPQIVYETDADGRIVFANRQWSEYTGQDDAQTADLGPVVHPDDRGDMVRQWEAARAAGTPLQAEFRLRRAADGAYRWFLTRSVPVRDEAGRVIKWFGTSTDIHDQKRVEREFARLAAESERQRRLYETVLTNTPDFVYVFSLDHRVLYANDALIRMWGRGHDGAIGKTFLEIGYEPWHAEMHDREIDQVRATRQPIRGEVPFTGTHGKRQYDYIFVPVIGADGEVEAVAGTTRDVTERKETERQLRESEERQAFLIRLADTLRPLSDPVEVQADASRVLGEHLGANRVVYFEIRGDEYVIERDYTAGVQPLAGRYPVAAFGPAVLAGLLEGRTIVEADATTAPDRPPAERAAFAAIRVRGHVDVPLVKGGRFVAGMAVQMSDRRDWTRPEVALIEETAGRAWAAVERVRAEREVVRLAAEADRERRLFAAVLSNTPDFIYTFDLQGRFVYVNAALLALWGRTLDEAVGRNFFDLGYPPALADRLQRQIQQVIDTKQPVRDDTPYTSGLGERMYEYIFAPVIGTGDAVEAVAGSTRDITDRKLAEAERERLVNRLRDEDRRKDEFLATLAHELRNPLAPIRTGLQVIRMAGADGPIEQVRSMMVRQVGQLTRLVDDLLDVSRVTSGKLQLRKTPIELRAVIDDAVETSRPAIEQAGHDLAVVVPERPIIVDGDPIRLAQVVSNLLTNSARYTHRGGHIRLEVSRDDAAAVVTVSDDGIGIPRSMLEAVFGMFTQVDRTLEKTTGGLGIGLSLVKGLVEMHGGTVEARSQGQGRGSEFVVRLPVATSVARAASPVPGEAPGLVPPRHRRVLVVDDNVDAADSLAQLVGMFGNEVCTAYDGQAGVEAARMFRPGVVLCDIGMPKVNGYNVARSIRAEEWGRSIVLVALTGWGQADDRQKSADAGFDHHVVKPVDDAALMKLLAGLQGTD